MKWLIAALVLLAAPAWAGTLFNGGGAAEWWLFPERVVYALFAVLAAVLCMALLTSRWVAHIIAPNFDEACAVVKRMGTKSPPTQGEAALAGRVLISTTLRIATILVVAAVWAVAL